jgi:hypothetical protein
MAFFVEAKYAIFGSDLVEPAVIKNTHMPGLVRVELVSRDQGHYHYNSCNRTVPPLGPMIGHGAVFINGVNVNLCGHHLATERPTSTVLNRCATKAIFDGKAGADSMIPLCCEPYLGSRSSGSISEATKNTPCVNQDANAADASDAMLLQVLIMAGGA